MSREKQNRTPGERVLADVVARVRETIERHGLLAAGDRVVVACSGGPDSVALLAILQRCGLDLELVVGHVDHGLRAESASDAEAVAALAGREGLEFVQRTLELEAPESGGGVSEDTMRRARLAALDEMAGEVGAVRIALGHTADDQLETVVMRLCRGAGLTGLSGMAPRRGRLVRPLMELGRAEVLATLEAVGWTAREDPTNRSERYLRNRVRRDVVPLLKRENPRLLEAVTRSTRGLREELEALTYYEDREWRRLARRSGGGAGGMAVESAQDAVDVAGVAALPPGLTTRLVRRLWRAARGRVRNSAGEGAEGRAPAELTRDHVEAVLALLARDTGPRLELPGGVMAYRQYDLLVVAPAAQLADPGDVALEVAGPGTYSLPALGLVLEVVLEVQAGGEGEGAGAGEDAPGEPWHLTVRNLRAGDRLAVTAGSRKLSDYLVDRKVPRWRRRRLALVVWRGEIVWIPGVWSKDGVVVADQTATLAGLGVRLLFREA